MNILKPLFAWHSPKGANARLSILIFHRVLPQPDPLFPNEMHASRFDTLCGWLRSWFNVLPLDMAARHLAIGTLPERAACITFDDGYSDNATIAMPILQRHGLTATFFVATSFLNGGRMWNDTVIESVRKFQGDRLDLREAGLGEFEMESLNKRRTAIDELLGQIKYLELDERKASVDLVRRAAGIALADDLMMTSAQVVSLSQQGMQIGAHTCSHPILATLPDQFASAEICQSKALLEDLVDAPVELFAYPNGKPGKDYLHKHTRMVKESGFLAAVSTAPGVSSLVTDAFQLARFSPWDKNRYRYGVRMLLNMRQGGPQLAADVVESAADSF
jgi:peptidoglycan/xylan/chitin deacetylase (PgdA/CDA1 family)